MNRQERREEKRRQRKKGGKQSKPVTYKNVRIMTINGVTKIFGEKQ